MTRIDTNSPNQEALRAELSRQGLATQRKAPSRESDKAAHLRTSTDGMDAPGAGHATLESHSGTLAAAALGDPAAASLFASLMAGDAVSSVRTLGLSVDLTHDTTPPPELLASASLLEGAILGEGADGRSPKKVAEGMLLLLSDGVDADAQKSGAERGVTSQLGRVIFDEKTSDKATQKLQSVLLSSRAQFPMGMDINAFVQAVLRECYLFQTEQLRDYADKVDYFNKLKKQIRAKLTEARALRSQPGLTDGTMVDFDMRTWDAQAGEWTSFEPGADLMAKLRAAANAADEGSGDGVPGKGTEANIDGDSTTPAAANAAHWNADLQAYFHRDSTPMSNPVANIIHLMWTEHGKGTKWKDMEAKTFGPRRPDEYGSLFAANTASLTPSEYVGLVQYVYECVRDPANKKFLLSVIAEHSTGEQLARLASGNVLYWQSVAASATAANTFQRFSDARGALPLSLRQDPAYGDLCTLYASVVADSPEVREASAKRLREAVWDMPSDKAETFFKELFKNAPDIASGVFSSCDGERILGSADPVKWSFLSAATGDVAEFYRAWNGVPAGGGGGVDASLFRRAWTIHDSPQGGAAVLRSTAYQEWRGPRAMVSGGLSGVFDDAPVNEPHGQPGEAEPAQDDGQVAYHAEVFDAYIKDLEEKLAGAGDDAQLANVDLQNALQQQQQTLQMMSNISKMLHDTAMSVIRKIGG